jgi:hypothetical protein
MTTSPRLATPMWRRYSCVVYGEAPSFDDLLVRERLIRSDIADADVQMIIKRLTPGLAGYVVVIVLGLFLPVLADFGYLFIAVYIIVPFGALRRRRTATT